MMLLASQLSLACRDLTQTLHAMQECFKMLSQKALGWMLRQHSSVQGFTHAKGAAIQQQHQAATPQQCEGCFTMYAKPTM